MSDYDPKLNKPAYDDVAFEPHPPSRGLYLVVGVVAAIVAAAGLMFFSGDRPGGNELARNPDPAAIDAQTNATRTPAVPRVAPIPATPTPEPVTPAPSQQP
ncbi:MAG: hypothetical protein EPO10_00115 [Reyranella sp.]|uniref:hypothetical protein n=1 Tax=Reyranella sp. TaxID=1929291 RepID=UPI00120DD7DC|nr:hypothetical protein [Reyranella sp.]TAJ86381.1 MAG: hypothetical protein EPO41_25110 [Reyranella sp.]TBR30968.1 MAG: hypothetical protein EPO10_00115 [Reyranella sp.]